MNTKDPAPSKVKSRWAFHGPPSVTHTTDTISIANNDKEEIQAPEKAKQTVSSSPLNTKLDETDTSEHSTSKHNDVQSRGEELSMYRHANSHQASSNRYYHGVHPKHLKPSKWSGFWTLVNSIALLLTLLLQGSLLNYYLINFMAGRSEWYFLFLFDFVILVLFMFSIAFAWRFHQRNRKTIAVTDTDNSKGFLDLKTATTADHERYGSGIFRFSFPKALGMLPLIYICWIVYAFGLTVKIIFLYSLRIPEQMITENFYAPKETLLISLAGSVAVFLFWVEAHWNLGDERQRHLSKPSVDDLISHTTFEFFDSLTFLDLVTPDNAEEMKTDDQLISFTMKMIVVAFAAINFLLPTLGLYRLSRTHYGEKSYNILCVSERTGKPSTRGLGISIMYHLLRLVAVNIPYMVIRIILSSGEARKQLSIFVIKNILGILIAIRNLIPEIKMWLLISKFKSKVRADLTSEGHNGLSNGNLRFKVDPSGKFDPTNQAWELPTIFESKSIDSSSRNPNISHSSNQFNTRTLSNESSVDDIEEMDTATTTSSPSPGSKQKYAVKT